MTKFQVISLGNATAWQTGITPCLNKPWLQSLQCYNQKLSYRFYRCVVMIYSAV